MSQPHNEILSGQAPILSSSSANMEKAQETSPSPVAPVIPMDVTATPVDASTTKQEPTESEARSLSSASSLNERSGNDAKVNAAEAQNDDLARQPSAAPSEYPPPKQVAAIMVAILLSVFLVSLDRTIIATAIPSITNEFNSLDDIGWYASAFMLTASVFQLLLGRMYTFYPPKYIFLTLILIFEVGSAICGAAPNSVAFIIGRAIAGLGSAGILNGAIILMVSVIPLHKRPFYQGFFGAVFGVSSVIGPLLGGAFTTDVTWRWCFYINLPIGGASMIAILFLLKPTEPQQPGLTIKQQLARLDLLGEFFLLPSIICLLLALQWGGSTYPFNDWRIIFLFTMFGVLFIGFCLVQVFMQKTATIPLRVIKNRSIIVAMWYSICLSGVMLVLVYYLSIWFQAIKGTTAVQSGIDTIPMVLALVLGSILAGATVGRFGYYAPLMIASAIIMPIGAGLIYTFNINTPEGQWIGYQILVGFGVGIGMQQGAMAAQTVLSKIDVPIGVSLIMFMQQLGGAIFVSVGQNVFTTKLVDGLITLVPQLSPQSIVNTGATDLRGNVPDAELGEVLVAYNAALQNVFLVSVVLGCLAIIGAVFMPWNSVKKNKKPANKDDPEKQQSEEQKTAVHPTEKVEEQV